MKDWNTIFSNLSDSEKDKVAILRVMECANGVMQYAYRDKKIFAYSTYETRKAMKFSMSCIKNMAIPLKEETIIFEPETEKIVKEIRDLYVSGFKHNNDADLQKFMIASAACIQSLGEERIVKAKDILAQNITSIPLQVLDWGVQYIRNFLP